MRLIYSSMPKISKILTDGPIVVNVFKLLKADESIRWGQDISLRGPTFLGMMPSLGKWDVPIFASYGRPYTQPEVPEPRSDLQEYEPLCRHAR
jgi:hypothetical protein